MNASKANLLNAGALVIMGLWGYFETTANTALIPVVGGIILLACQKGVSSENKMIAHIAVLLTLILIGGIVKPFLSAMGDNDTMGMLRTGIMLLTGIVALIYFIKSFIAARKARESA